VSSDIDIDIDLDFEPDIPATCYLRIDGITGDSHAGGF
jgi:hypothetical protein